MNNPQLLEVLNDIWNSLEKKPLYKDFNKTFICKDSLGNLEEQNEKIGIIPPDTQNGEFKISILTIIATITDVLCDKRLAAVVDSDGIINSWTWYNCE